MPVDKAPQSRAETVEVHLAEYNWLTSVESMYLRWQHEVLYLALALVSGFVIIAKDLPSPYFEYALLSLPVPISLLSLILAGLQSRVSRLAYYIHTDLRSKITPLVGKEVLGWVQYLANPPAKARFALGYLPVIAYYLPIWAFFGLCQIIPLGVFFLFPPNVPIPYHMILILVDLILIIVSLAAFVLVALPRFRKIC